MRRICTFTCTPTLRVMLAGILLGGVVGLPRPSFACTAFWAATAERGPVVAKNFDWPSHQGYVVWSERGRLRRKMGTSSSSAKSPTQGTWTVALASLSFTTVGPGLPVGGMNEAGLVIEALVDASAHSSAELDPDRVSPLELVQKGLDLFSSTSDLADFVRREGLAQVAIPLHLLACDLRGCIVIEGGTAGGRGGQRGQVLVHQGIGAQDRILANNAYEKDRDAHPSRLACWLGWGETGKVGGSAARYATVARALASHPPTNERESLALLGRVGSRYGTAWRLAWNLRAQSVIFSIPALDRPPVELHFNDMKARGSACAGAPQVLRIGAAGLDEQGWHRWSRLEQEGVVPAVLRQMGSSPAVHGLAHAVAAAVGNTGCAPSQ